MSEEKITYAPAASRDGTGRFLPGNPGGPGRPTKAQEHAYLAAAAAAVTPDEMTHALREALHFALEQRSARGIVAVLEFIRDTTVGRPNQAVQVSAARTSLTELLALLPDDFGSAEVSVTRSR